MSAREIELRIKFKEMCCLGISVPENMNEWNQQLLTEYNCFCGGYGFLQEQIGSKDKEIKILREALEFYGDPEHWMIKENAGWRHSSPRSYLDEEMILDYKHPYSDWVGTIKPGGKRARQALAEIDKTKEDQKEIKGYQFKADGKTLDI